MMHDTVTEYESDWFKTDLLPSHWAQMWQPLYQSTVLQFRDESMFGSEKCVEIPGVDPLTWNSGSQAHSRKNPVSN